MLEAFGLGFGGLVRSMTHLGGGKDCDDMSVAILES